MHDVIYIFIGHVHIFRDEMRNKIKVEFKVKVTIKVAESSICTASVCPY